MAAVYPGFQTWLGNPFVFGFTFRAQIKIFPDCSRTQITSWNQKATNRIRSNTANYKLNWIQQEQVIATYEDEGKLLRLEQLIHKGTALLCKREGNRFPPYASLLE